MRHSSSSNFPEPRSLRVLVVHDSRSAPPAVDADLRAAGMHVKVVPLGEQALNHVRAHIPDVVVLSAGGPESAGAAFVGTLRGLPAPPGILLLADGSGPGELHQADDFVPLLAAEAELVLRVEVLAARRALSAADTSLRAGPLLIDMAARQVRVDGRPVSVTMTEFELLCLLVRNVGRVVTKSAILDHMGRHEFQGESNLVETYVWSLRRKLADGDRSLIRTVRGGGYVFAVDWCAGRLAD